MVGLVVCVIVLAVLLIAKEIIWTITVLHLLVLAIPRTVEEKRSRDESWLKGKLMKLVGKTKSEKKGKKEKEDADKPPDKDRPEVF